MGISEESAKTSVPTTGSVKPCPITKRDSKLGQENQVTAKPRMRLPMRGQLARIIKAAVHIRP
jgi:hypothetical protein